jgi:hypothetical protein
MANHKTPRKEGRAHLIANNRPAVYERRPQGPIPSPAAERVQQATSRATRSKHRQAALTQQIRIAIAQQKSQSAKQIDNAQVQDYLRSKYSNTDLYAWMDRNPGLYCRPIPWPTTSRRRRKAVPIERGLAASDFIQFGYWDGGHDGLLAGERLYHGLKQLRRPTGRNAAQQDHSRSRCGISTRWPGLLRETGMCEFTVPEVLFDMTTPGTTCAGSRQSQCCPRGRPTGLNCTLRLLEHKYRISSLAQTANGYPEKTDDTDDRFTTVNATHHLDRSRSRHRSRGW